MYRLVTRSDFDGLVCAMLLKQLGMVDEISFVHPKDVQDGTVAITGRDITTNLPYRAEAHMVFDHHASELLRVGNERAHHIIDPAAPSAARVVYDHFGGAAAFPGISPELMRAVDQADSADYTMDEVLHPEGWVLLGFLMDARTGLGRFHDFRVSNYDLMMHLIDYCLTHDIDQVLRLPDVAERVALYRAHEEPFRQQLRRCTRVVGDVAVIDLRGEDVIYSGNRFVVYALHPEASVSIHVMWGRERRNTVLAVGRSIFNPLNSTDIGALMLAHGGGGHRNAGTCQIPHDVSAEVLAEVVDALAAGAAVPAG